MKALPGALEQLGGGVEVNFGAGDRTVAKIGREERKFGRQIRTLPVPGHEPMDGEGVAQVMNAGPRLALGPAKSQAPKDLQEKSHEPGMSVPGSDDVQEHRRGRTGREPSFAARP